MIKKIDYTPIFKRGYKRAKKRHLNTKKLEEVIQLIVAEETELLFQKYKDHSLKGSHKGLRELHIEKNWLLVYKVVQQELKLYLLATGNHDEVFRETQKSSRD